MMNRMQKYLARAAKELDLRIELGYVIHLQSGNTLPTQALFPDLSGALGMVVIDSAENLDEQTENAITDHGLSISTFSQPLPNEKFDIDSYLQMFAEWGWTGDPSKRPRWMTASTR